MAIRVIRKKIKHPFTKKGLNEVYVIGKGKYRWNPVFRVYNNLKTYDQLTTKDKLKIDYRK